MEQVLEENMSVTRSGNRMALWLLILALLLPALWLAPAPPPVDMDKVQPALRALVAERPEAMVPVIVQKQVANDSVDQQVAALGGIITKDLHIINAFAAEIPSDKVIALASNSAVRWISLDAPMLESARPCRECIDTSNLTNAYIRAIRADQVWNEPDFIQGQDITVAVLDSGMHYHEDFLTEYKQRSEWRILTGHLANHDSMGGGDEFGHGTHVAGIIGGNGYQSDGAYIGVAPQVKFVNVKVSDSQGAGTTSDVVGGLQWIYDNKDLYNIRVVNISLNSSVPESYHMSPIDAAMEILWFNGIVVVASAGNNGDGDDNGILYPPANDPFVITVGAMDDQGTADVADDTLAPYSAYGISHDGIAKPDLVAPGSNIVSGMPYGGSVLASDHPDHIVPGSDGSHKYFRMSGTSMATAVTTGAVALLLQDEPHLTPDQVKFRLMETARAMDHPGTGAGYLDIHAAVHGTTTGSANTGLVASQLLWTGSEPVTWTSVNWNSVNWNSVNWNSVNWNSVNWNSVNWNSVNWNE